MIINGGYSSDETWTTDDGETYGALPPMPQGMHWHCAVALDGSDLFVTGMSRDISGIDISTTFLYHSDTMGWEQLPGLPSEPFRLTCGMVHNLAGEQEVIVVNGCQSPEIYNLVSGQWRTGQPSHVLTVKVHSLNSII